MHTPHNAYATQTVRQKIKNRLQTCNLWQTASNVICRQLLPSIVLPMQTLFGKTFYQRQQKKTTACQRQKMSRKKKMPQSCGISHWYSDENAAETWALSDSYLFPFPNIQAKNAARQLHINHLVGCDCVLQLIPFSLPSWLQPDCRGWAKLLIWCKFCFDHWHVTVGRQNAAEVDMCSFRIISLSNTASVVEVQRITPHGWSLHDVWRHLHWKKTEHKNWQNLIWTNCKT